MGANNSINNVLGSDLSAHDANDDVLKVNDGLDSLRSAFQIFSLIEPNFHTKFIVIGPQDERIAFIYRYTTGKEKPKRPKPSDDYYYYHDEPYSESASFLYLAKISGYWVDVKIGSAYNSTGSAGTILLFDCTDIETSLTSLNNQYYTSNKGPVILVGTKHESIKDPSQYDEIAAAIKKYLPKLEKCEHFLGVHYASCASLVQVEHVVRTLICAIIPQLGKLGFTPYSSKMGQKLQAWTSGRQMKGDTIKEPEENQSLPYANVTIITCNAQYK